MPAKQMGIADKKGFIGLGADADIVVFDPKTIRSNSDYVGIGRPDAPPTGIDYVIVNGVTVVKESKSVPDQLPGKIMRQANKPWTL
jgi:N-acyl-D-amino-acid deacylase